LLTTTAVAAYEYYVMVRKAHKEYIKARDFVEDIVLSFNRELRRESEKFDSMIAKVEESNTTAESSHRKTENLEKKIIPFVDQINTLNQSYETITQAVTSAQTQATQNQTSLISSIFELETKLTNIEVNQQTLKTKISSFDEQIQNLAHSSHATQQRTEVILPPIPIKRDKALAALTLTEISVLEMLSKEGAKTAPEIKERVQLSREHTARLMKNLYEEGYLEREAGKIPFRYSIKKEMEALLQKVENPTTD
jgi:DNA-binding MarR family transcriptional regulator